MSLKPLKKSDLDKDWLPKRRDSKKSIQPEYHLIVTEGTKTEPNYFNAIKQIINQKYKERIQIEVSGEGDNTVNLFEIAKDYAEKNPNGYKHVWVVYDTDDFPKENIDAVPVLCKENSNKDRQYHAVWSNQCIELWYLLHFSFMQADLHRSEYSPKLNDCLAKINAGKYKKNREDMYDVLKPYMDEAIRNAKNRLYARDIQEKYLNYLLKDTNFNKFKNLINNSSNIKMFLESKMIEVILNSFEETMIIDGNKAQVYYYVVSKYSLEGTSGVIKYHINKLIEKQKLDSNVQLNLDSAYIRSFDQIRNIVEYEVPKLLCLFESIFAQTATIKGYNMENFNLSPIIRYFELGVTTEFGLSLIEFGFPVDTIRELEKKFSKLDELSTIEAITYLRGRHRAVTNILDEYELELFKSAIQSFEK